MIRASRTARTFALGVIVAGITACDNVNWGGADVAVVPPPPRSVPTTPQDSASAAEERMPTGPVLYHVRRDSMRATMTPIAELSGDTMLPVRPSADPELYGTRYIAEQLRQGSEFALYTGGMRVGTFVVQSASVPEGGGICAQQPRAEGSLELSAAAGGVQEFLAIGKQHAPQMPRRGDDQLAISRNMQVIGPILAERLIRRRGASLPGNWQSAMEQLKPFPAANQQTPAFSATFLVGDTLGPGMDDEGYSMFFVAMPALASYDTTYVDYRNYADTGKEAPRVVDFLDWTRDDQVDLLIEVFGISDRWYEAVSQSSDGEWRRVFRDRCRSAAAQPAAEEAPDTTS